MIDVERERLFRLTEAPDYLPRRWGQKKLHSSTVFRWAQRGIRGVRLETIRLGGALYTSAQAVQRFANQLTDRADSSVERGGNESDEAARLELERIGL